MQTFNCHCILFTKYQVLRYYFIQLPQQPSKFDFAQGHLMCTKWQRQYVNTGLPESKPQPLLKVEKHKRTELKTILLRDLVFASSLFLTNNTVICNLGHLHMNGSENTGIPKKVLLSGVFPTPKVQDLIFFSYSSPKVQGALVIYLVRNNHLLAIKFFCNPDFAMH